MADITRSLSQERRMKIEQLQKQTDISEKELESLLNNILIYVKKRIVSKSLYRQQEKSIVITL